MFGVCMCQRGNGRGHLTILYSGMKLMADVGVFHLVLVIPRRREPRHGRGTCCVETIKQGGGRHLVRQGAVSNRRQLISPSFSRQS